MLKKIDLKHFKCFKDLELSLCPLTLLSGANASGKSSVLQALALLHQTMREHEWSSDLMLNGTAVRLGSAGQVIDDASGENKFEIGLLADEGQCQWEFESKKGDSKGDDDGKVMPDDMSMKVRKVSFEPISFESKGDKGMSTKVRKVSFESEGDNKGDKGMSMKVGKVSGKNWQRPPGTSQPLRLHHLLPEPRESDDELGKVTLMAKRLRELNYLTAERMGPREIYPLHDRQATPVIGPRGEHVASLLWSKRHESIRLKGLIIEGDPPTLHRQTLARMRRFFPGSAVEAGRVEAGRTQGDTPISAVALVFRTSSETNYHSPIHTGFGLTQVLPIVVAALSLDKGGLLLVENPEVHLHPAGQAKMGEFLAEVAKAGAQVILETHSDHVLNGIRRAVKNKVLHEDKVALHFFRTRRKKQSDGPPQVESPQVESPKLDAGGNVDSWPDGFFDQFEKDLNHFIGWD